MIDSSWMFARDVTTGADSSRGGAGSALNPAVLISAGVATFVATAVSALGIWLQLKVRGEFSSASGTEGSMTARS